MVGCGHDHWMSPLYGEDTRTTVVTWPHDDRQLPDVAPWAGPAPKRVGYARIHGADQTAVHDAVQVLVAAGVIAAHIHVDRGTRRPAQQRPGWADATADLRRGDVLVVPSLAGLARSEAELRRLLSELGGRGVEVQVPGSRQPLSGLSGMRRDLLAELAAERDFWLARSAGRRGGRRRVDPARELAVIEAFDVGGDRRETAARLGMSRARLYRIGGVVLDGWHATCDAPSTTSRTWPAAATGV